MSGHDDGALPTSNWLYVYYPYAGIWGDWNSSPSIDGCVDAAGSNPSALDPDQCMAVLLADHWKEGFADPTGWFLMMSDRTEQGLHFFDDPNGQSLVTPHPSRQLQTLWQTSRQLSS